MPAAGLSGVLKLIHVLAAMAWVGGSVLLIVLGMRSMAASRDERITFAKQMLIAGRVFSVFAAVALAAGVWMVVRDDIWGFEQAWISIGFLGIAVGAVLGPAFYGPQGRALIGELESGSAGAGARLRRIGVVSTLEALLLLVVVWAMVYKPGGPF